MTKGLCCGQARSAYQRRSSRLYFSTEVEVNAHIEIIKSGERIDPTLGGTGYLPPSRPATIQEIAEAVRSGHLIFKVARNSVNWKHRAESRRLQLPECQIPCVVVGGMREWWFVRLLD